jgi:hypothetical protein
MRNLNQKKNRNSCPSQNTGADTPNSAKSIPARSRADRGFVAEAIPMGIPMSSHVAAAPRARVIVTGSRS